MAHFVGPLAHRAGARRVDHAMPHRGHAADNGGPNQHHGKRAQLAVKYTDHALVAGKQARHTARGGGVHRKQVTGHIHHAFQLPGAGHVNAVVITRAQIQRGKLAVLELGRQGRIAAQQGLCAVAVALGLKHAIAGNRSALADGAVHRADQRRRRQGAGVGPQRAGEKGVEAEVAGRVGVGCFGHVHVVAFDKPVDDRCRHAAPLAARHPTGKDRQGLLGNQVLRQHRQAVRKRRGHETAARADQKKTPILSGVDDGLPRGRAGTIQP